MITPFKFGVKILQVIRKFLVDNGGEFANAKFLEMAESMNIKVMMTAAFSPWSNGLVERHNATLASILHKVLAEQDINMETALCWDIICRPKIHQPK